MVFILIVSYELVELTFLKIIFSKCPNRFIILLIAILLEIYKFQQLKVKNRQNISAMN